MARTKGSGHRSQLYILLVLREFGPLYGQEVMDKTGLHREEVWRNLKVLVEKEIIKKEKVGRRAYYSPNVNERTLEYIIAILYEGGLRKIREEWKRNFKKMNRLFSRALPALEKADEYEDELIELGVTPYAEALPHAAKWREVKREWRSVGQMPSVDLSEAEKKKARELVRVPRELQTKEIVLPESGLRVVIRRMTVLEILDAYRESARMQPERDLNLARAVTRLSQPV